MSRLMILFAATNPVFSQWRICGANFSIVS
jgi:hypothetical protein